MFGHIGYSYGLIADAFIDPVGEYGIVWVTNGPKTGNNFIPSKESAFLEPESDSFDILQKYSRSKCLGQQSQAVYN